MDDERSPSPIVSTEPSPSLGMRGHAQCDHAIDDFVQTYEAKYPKSAVSLVDSRDKLVTHFDFPAEHWQHLRTTNPIESTFATVKLRQR